eukprot:CAMPEP_0172198388 /NCGR_PEP_ID=MMETSP1050-20130122/28051_1 /TAXON_ID=233186 /ORGANISM="Cryptomonas curvata, Strain CCAP979/52" /LENGTH=174 /DNA_ID=CAMNT_0012875187 /DNA_START=231 /DNA_END=755 /DNA_ORIENTATION=-
MPPDLNIPCPACAGISSDATTRGVIAPPLAGECVVPLDLLLLCAQHAVLNSPAHRTRGPALDPSNLLTTVDPVISGGVVITIPAPSPTIPGLACIGNRVDASPPDHVAPVPLQRQPFRKCMDTVCVVRYVREVSFSRLKPFEASETLVDRARLSNRYRRLAGAAETSSGARSAR